ncbi:MAG: leucine-rich repeat domain-containing protein, partial [Lachnospiraceae bacterium]|nr:leucine-rich repeat domain-containing protein [Lachnospiraceae bacterium]
MAGRFRKTVGILLLITAVIISQIPTTDASASVGDYKLNGDTLIQYTGNDENVTIPAGVRVIGEDAFSGNLSMKTLTIPNGVEEIRYHAFSGCDMLESVNIADSVRIIGQAVFSDCGSLKDVTIGDGLVNMGGGVFAGCPNLSTVNIKSSKYHCRGGVIYNEAETTLVEMLGGCETTAYEMPSTVTRIDPYAFWNCDKLAYVQLSAALSEIPAYSFSGCTGLTAVSVPYSVKRIEAKAFSDCRNLQYAEIPGTVSWIHPTAFDGCYQLKPVTESGSAAESYFLGLDLSPVARAEYEDVVASILSDAVVQPDSYTTPTNSPTTTAGAEITGGASVTAGADVTGSAQASDAAQDQPQVSVPSYYNPLVPENGILGKTMIVSGDAVVFIDNTRQYVYQTGNSFDAYYAENESLGETATITQAASPEMEAEATAPNAASEVTDSETAPNATAYPITTLPYPKESAPLIMESPYSEEEKGVYFPKHAVVNGNKIVDQAFYKQTDMTEYVFDQGITEIGDFSFARTGLTSVMLPDGLETIGYGAFYHCDGLNEVEIPASVRTIEPYAFANTPWLTNWMNGSGDEFLIVGDGILLAYRGSNSKIEIPDGVRSIAQGCFSGHTGIVSVSLPPSLEIICEEAFADCRNLSSITGGVNVKKIEDRAFAGCPLTTVKIGSHVEEVGLRAFDTTGTLQQGKSVTLDFQGGELPSVGVTETSQRLYNEAYRGLAFCGADVAMVPDENVTLDGTVLDPSQNGFRGVICCFNDDGVTILKYTGAGVNPLTISLPTMIRYYGKEYPVTQIREDVFSYLLPQTNGEENSSDSGWNASENANVTPAISAGQQTNGHITVSLRSNVLTKPDCVQVETSVITGNYNLIIADDVLAKQEMLDVYRSLYGNADNLLLYGFDISMRDDSSIPITGLGKKNLLLTVPVPDDMEPEHARVLCMDEDGQLESVAAQLTEKNGQPCLQFYARHFSHYGIYTFLNEQGVQVSHG